MKRSGIPIMLGELIDMPAGEHLVTIVVAGGIQISLLSQQGRELTLSRHETGSVLQFGGICIRASKSGSGTELMR